MSRPMLLLCLCLLFCKGAHADFIWTGAANDQIWGTPANWSPSGPPGSSDTAILSAQGVSNSNLPQIFVANTANILKFLGTPDPTSIGLLTQTSDGIVISDSIQSSGGTNSIAMEVAFLGVNSSITTSTGILSFKQGIVFEQNSIVFGGGITEFGNANLWILHGTITLNGGNLLVSNLEALGETVLGFTTLTMLHGSTLHIGINNFIISAFPITLTNNETINTNGFNATINSVISGTGGLLKDGAGTLFLTSTGVNTYLGGTSLNAGTLNIVQDSNLGSPALLQMGGGSTLQAGGSFALVSGRPINFPFVGIATVDTGAFNPSIAGNINGIGSLAKIGSGTLTLSGANNYTGATLVDDGTLVAGSITAFAPNSPVTIASGATLALNSFNNAIGGLTGPGSVTLGTATLTINNGGNFSGTISGPGANGLILNSGTLFLSGVNTYTGTTQIAGGILNINADNPLGGPPPGILRIDDGATLQAGGNFTLAPARTVDLFSGKAMIDTNGNDLTIAGQITGAGTLNKIGAGTLFLTKATNNYTGGTTITSGTLNIQINTNLGALGGSLTINNGGTLQAGTTFTLSRPVTLSGTANIDTNNFELTISSSISNPMGGSGTLNKINRGTLILSGVNTYSGGTIVNADTLEIFLDSNLGANTGQLTMLGGTTLLAGGPFLSLSPSRPVFLGSGVVTINTQGFNSSIGGPISGPGTLFKTGEDGTTLTLTNSNSYSGGTTIQEGTLIIYRDNNLGSPAPLTIAGGSTLKAADSFSLVAGRSVNLSGGTAIVDTGALNPTIAGIIGGPGLLQKNGPGTLNVLGANTYSGSTLVNAGTLQGNTTSLQGNIQIVGGAALAFNQGTSGTYSGLLSGPGALNILGGGSVTIAGSSPSFSGPTTVSGNSTLVMNGSLASSPATINQGSTITGTGTIGSLTNSGRIIPGSLGAGTLTVNGDLSFIAPGSLVTQLTPSSTGLLAVNGSANLTNGTSEIHLFPGFYGIDGVRTILTAGLVNGTFANLILDPRIEGSLVYNPTNVQLVFKVINPFLGFPFANANERAVGRNIDALQHAGELSADFVSVIDSMQGLSISQINDALDQLHPAAMGAFAELQAELGGQLLSMFHRRPTLACGCNDSTRFWVEPFGNWLHEKAQGMQIGFHATTRGVALGLDHQFFRCWTIGIGGAYSASDLDWSLDRGYAYVKSAYASAYSDISVGNFYLGFSGYWGRDFYDAFRHIRFSTIDRQAKSHFHGLDMGAQLTTAYFFGTKFFQLYPYATVDYLYLKNKSFSETGALSIDLNVDSYTSSNLRAEAGGALRFVDRNRDDTICIAPLISIGYVLELPLHRDRFRAEFAGTSIPFRTQGWDMAWQLLNLKMGLDITYRCFTLSATYGADISPEGDSPFFNQRANFKMSVNF